MKEEGIVETKFISFYFLDSCIQYINEKRSLHQNTPPVEWDYVTEADAQGCVENVDDCFSHQVLYGTILLRAVGSYAESNEAICRMAFDQM